MPNVQNVPGLAILNAVDDLPELATCSELHPTPADPYVDWLERTEVPLFQSGGTWWRLYQSTCLLPVSLKPTPLRLQARDARDLLRRSGALFLRHFTTTFDRPTDFWYSQCTE